MEYSEQSSSNSSLLRDISNFRTPSRPSQARAKPDFQSPNPQFFTASRPTPLPLSSARRGSGRARPSLSARSKNAATVRKLRAFELEQSQSSRKVELRKERSLRTLAKSLTAWLNFLFRNPKACRCDLDRGWDQCRDSGGAVMEKRKIGPEGEVGFNPAAPSLKRMRDLWWQKAQDNDCTKEEFSNSIFTKLRTSLEEVCSLDDLKERMLVYLSLASCKEIFEVMTRVCKNIDDGRLKMKAHCPIITDFGMKEKAVRVLLCYNPVWLRIGLYIILGGDSLLPDGDVDSDQDIEFLKLVIERQFLTHAALAKAYAYNKKVEGLYRPGYYESLGNIIMKRFLLLVLILDRAKSQSSVPMKYGIDGVDGGSPLLFTVQSTVKSSSQVVNDFLSSDVMHGEGNLLSHLIIVGFKVSYQQCPLVEYEFKLNDVLDDLHDGVRLSRAIQLLKQDSSILLKLVVPADTLKKKLANCNVALQYLKHFGMPLNDEDGLTIVADDVAGGDKELTLSLLWNMFVHLQLPLLIDKRVLAEEVCRVRGQGDESMLYGCTILDLIFQWIQAICDNYAFRIDNLDSLTDGKAIWCLLDFYFRKELCCSSRLKDDKGKRGESIMSMTDYTDAVHNFILSQKLTGLLGGFPEILQISDVLEHHAVCNSRSVVILLVFLANHLVMKKNMDHLNFHKLLGCTCQNVDRRRSSHQHLLVISDSANQEDASVALEAAKRFRAVQAWWQSMAERNHKSISNPVNSTIAVSLTSKAENENKRDNAACLIQSHYRCLIERRKFLKTMHAISLLQCTTRAWLIVRQKILLNRSLATAVDEILWGRSRGSESFWRCLELMFDRHSFIKVRRSILLIQCATRKWINWRCQHRAATKIQCHIRGWLSKCKYLHLKQATSKIQTKYRHLQSLRSFQYTQLRTKSAIIIQSQARRWVCQQWYRKCHRIIVQIQSWWRGWLIRKDYLARRTAAITIQSFVRGQITQKRLIGSSCDKIAPGGSSLQTTNGDCQNFELKILLSSTVRLQRWWRSVLHHRLRTKSATVIQSYARQWIARRRAASAKHRIVLIQSYWKGFLARKESRGQVVDLRLRVQKAAENVDDSMRIINRLKAALSELLNMRSVSSILHTCATLDMATRHSQKCCEKLVEAGAIDKLLKLIRAMTRSIPDQEVLKHALSTLRNLAHYPHLLDVLIDSHGSIEVIFWELLRNKEDIFFISSELLKKVSMKSNGVEAVRKLPALLKRLNGLVDELTRKVQNERRNGRGLAAKDNTERRLKEAMELLKLMTC